MVEEQKLRQLAEAATKGPWTFVRHTCGRDGTHDANDDWTVYGSNEKAVCMEGASPALADPEYIAAANPASIFSLLDELQTLREERTAWRVTAENAEAAVKQARIDALEEAAAICQANASMCSEGVMRLTLEANAAAIESLKGKTP